ncbi:MAG: hypothetical protein IT428_13140 [Planctomycetaceae bacterium]|nr:hypothetical protein [Planctomycetaceae bacterium]
MTPVFGIRRTGLAALVAGSMSVAGLVAISQARSEDKRASESPIVQVGAETEKAGPKKDEKITIKAFMANDRLPAGGQCRVAMLVTIQEGWHINTNPANPKENIPTEFKVKSKLGTVLKGVQYPKGVEFVNTMSNQKESVYQKQVLLYGTLHIPKEAAGSTEELDLEVKYQPCNDKICLPPRTVKITGKVAVAAPGEEVKEINSKYFTSGN